MQNEKEEGDEEVLNNESSVEEQREEKLKEGNSDEFGQFANLPIAQHLDESEDSDSVENEFVLDRWESLNCPDLQVDMEEDDAEVKDMPKDVTNPEHPLFNMFGQPWEDNLNRRASRSRNFTGFQGFPIEEDESEEEEEEEKKSRELEAQLKK